MKCAVAVRGVCRIFRAQSLPFCLNDLALSASSVDALVFESSPEVVPLVRLTPPPEFSVEKIRVRMIMLNRKLQRDPDFVRSFAGSSGAEQAFAARRAREAVNEMFGMRGRQFLEIVRDKFGYVFTCYPDTTPRTPAPPHLPTCMAPRTQSRSEALRGVGGDAPVRQCHRKRCVQSFRHKQF